jgi:hypothetical protein
MVKDITQEIFEGQPKQETVAAFYQALAQAITLWQRVEMAMLEIAEIAVGPKLPGALAASFHSLQHTQSQLHFTDAALRFWFLKHVPLSTELQTEWVDNLFGKIIDKLQRRNELAHFSVMVIAQRKIEHEKIILTPAFTDTRYHTGKKRRQYSINEIAMFAENFLSLSRGLWDFRLRMIELETRLQAFRERSPH